MSFLALKNISVCSEWKEGLKAANSVIEHPSWLQEGQSDHKGWIWAGPFWTHWDKTAPGKDNWVAAASHAPEIWEKNALILPKSAIQKAARGTVFIRRASTWREQPHRPFMEQNHEEVLFVLEKPSSGLGS